ncbi:hypothetical protein HaLaN_00366, partial [Haematococcus lacustris]
MSHATPLSLHTNGLSIGCGSCSAVLGRFLGGIAPLGSYLLISADTYIYPGGDVTHSCTSKGHTVEEGVAQLASAQAPSQPPGTPEAMTPPPPSEGDSSSGQASSAVSERPLGRESMRLVPPLLRGTVDQGPVSQGQGPLPSLSSNALGATLVSDIGVTPPCAGITLPEADEELKYKKAQEMAGLVADSHLFRRMQQAMEMWATLSKTASTPSTVLPASLTEDLQAHLQRLASHSHRPRVSLSPQQQPCMQPGPSTHTPRTSVPRGATATVATAAAAI